jgi:hypothetical protein
MTTTADKRQPPAEARCIAPRRYYLVVGVLCGVFYSVMGLASTLAAYWNIDGSFPQPKLFALIFGVFWSGLTLLAVWIILAYLRERLYLTSTMIIQHGVIRSRTIYCADIVHINWRWRPFSGSIVIQTPSAKVKIYLNIFTRDERGVIIHFFREASAKELQDNWPLFEACELQGNLSLFNARRRALANRLVSRGRIIVAAAVLMTFEPVFVYCWFAGLGSQFLVIGVVNASAVICCLWLLWTYKDYGLTEESGGVQERPERRQVPD